MGHADMTLSAMLTHKRADIRALGRKRKELHEQLQREIGERSELRGTVQGQALLPGRMRRRPLTHSAPWWNSGAFA